MSNNAGCSIGPLGTLGIVFVVLKLTNVIAWPWIWVLSPLWISIALLLVAVIFVLLIGGIGVALDSRASRRFRRRFRNY